MKNISKKNYAKLVKLKEQLALVKRAITTEELQVRALHINQRQIETQITALLLMEVKNDSLRDG